jgi:hypothetical protein
MNFPEDEAAEKNQSACRWSEIARRIFGILSRTHSACAVYVRGYLSPARIHPALEVGHPFVLLANSGKKKMSHRVEA